MKKIQKKFFLCTVIAATTSLCLMGQAENIDGQTHIESPVNEPHTTATMYDNHQEHDIEDHKMVDNANVLLPSNTQSQEGSIAKKSTEDTNNNHENSIDDKNTPSPDQDEILKKIKIIDAHDNKTDMLLSQDSMNQIFNNFIYFKNFIVNNFTKDKMVHLAIEFINQLYPQENIPTISITQQAKKENVPTTSTTPQDKKESTPTTAIPPQDKNVNDAHPVDQKATVDAGQHDTKEQLPQNNPNQTNNNKASADDASDEAGDDEN
jgi:hypothetical protein